MRLIRFGIAPLLLLGAAFAAPYKHSYDLLDVNWGIAFNEADSTIVGDVTNTVAITEDGTTQIVFNEGKLNIKAVSVEGKDNPFTVQGEQLIITLHQAAHKDDRLRVRIQYTGKPTAGVYFVSPDRSVRPIKSKIVYTQGEAEDNRYWLPTYDEPDDKATSEGHITVPKGYFALSNGTLEEVVHEGDKDVFHWKMAQAHSTYLISFVAGKYFEGREKWEDVPVNYFVPEGLEAMGPPSFGGTADMVRFYSELTGVKYAYAKFAQSAVPDFPFGGMENISAVTQTINTLHPATENPISDSRGLVLHELAHQWFGDLVTCADWPHNWLNEGFATFLPHFYFREKDGEDVFQIGKLGDIEGGLGSMQFSPRPMVALSYNVPMDIFDGHAYSGGAARMFTLMSLLGEKTFWAGVKEYLTEYKFKAATTDQFFAVMSKSSGQDLSNFDKEWFHTSAVPTVTASKSQSTVTLTQSEPLFTLDLDVWSLHEGHWNQQKVALHGKEATVSLDDPSDPFVVDPMVKWMANINYTQTPSPEDILTLYRKVPNAATKVRLLDIASNNGDQPLIISLLKDETSQALRENLARRIGSDQTDLLLQLSGDPDANIRNTAAGKLGDGKNTDAVLARLRDLAKNEVSDQLKVTALSSLVRLTKDQALVDTAWTTDSFADGMRTFALRWYSNNKPDMARDLALKALTDGHSESVRLAAIPILGQVKDKAGEKSVFNALVALLNDHGHNTKLSAIRALGNYGDPAAAPYLDKLSDFSMYQVRNAAVNTAKQLRAKG
jgi:aminopeptidase N